jgi:hypothetical protein
MLTGQDILTKFAGLQDNPQLKLLYELCADPSLRRIAEMTAEEAKSLTNFEINYNYIITDRLRYVQSTFKMSKNYV